MKRLSLCALALALVCTVQAGAAGLRFPDVEESTPQGQAVYRLTDAGIVNGKSSGLFEPAGYLTRAQFVKVVNLLFGFQLTSDQTFADVPAEYWACGQIQIAAQAGYIQGYPDGTFRPDGLLTRQQFCVMLDRINHYQNLLGISVPIADGVGAWAEESVKNAIVCGLFTLPPDGRFRAGEYITRGEMALALAQYVTESGGASAGSAGGGETPENPNPPDTPEVTTPAKVLNALESAVSGLGKIQYTGSVMSGMIRTMRDCMDQAHQAALKGEYVDGSYIADHYSDEIAEVKEAYQGLSEDNQVRMRTDIATNISAAALELLQDYFF